MSTKWLAGMLTLGFGVTFLSLMLEGAYLGAESIGELATLMNPGFLEGTEEQGGVFIMAWSVIGLIPDMLFYNYSFLTGSWEVIKYIGWTLSGATIVMLAIALKPSWI